MHTCNYVLLYFYTHTSYIQNFITSPELEMPATALLVSIYGLLQDKNGNMTLRVSPTHANVKTGKTLRLSRPTSEKKVIFYFDRTVLW